MGEIRAFIAIDVPKPLLETLDNVRRQLSVKLNQGEVRWVKPSNIHLTLRFLGNVGEDILPALYEGLDEVAGKISPFALELDALGCFPNPNKPRVIWVGLAGELASLSALHVLVSDMVTAQGWDLEKRKFSPHLTLGRVKDPRSIGDIRLPWGEKVGGDKFNVRDIRLVESQLFPSGAVYVIRHTAELCEPPGF